MTIRNKEDRFLKVMKILNLYSGVGGNRKLWDKAQVTAVETVPYVAEIYSHHFPDDELVMSDAHHFLREHLEDGWDFIWTSPPCQTHSKMAISGRNQGKIRYPDMKLYEEIILLGTYSKRLGFSYVVENVVPYYGELIESQQVGRHKMWSNLDLSGIEDVPSLPKFIDGYCTVGGSKKIQEWLGISWDKSVYYEGNHDPSQIWRNAVHPLIGKQILDLAKKED
tara:strand:- start:170 stop:838 length:669 start_codon:yes stop_codon:yes gene_type:complete